MVAGCLGDDGETPTEEPGNGDDTGNGDDDTGNGDDDTGNGETPTQGGSDIERHDHTLKIFRGPPVPADAQFNPYAGTSMPHIAVGAGLRHDATERSYIDERIYGDMVESYQYQPGILEFTLHDDFYFWDGDNIDADTWMTHYNFESYLFGGDELDHDPDVVNAQAVDDYTIRYNLADAWNEDYAIDQTLDSYSVTVSSNYAGPYLNEFEDASGMDAIQDIRTKIEEELVHDPGAFYNSPFMFVEAQENHWEAKLRTREVLDEHGLDHDEPHYVDEINYTDVNYMAVDGYSQRSTEAFRNGETFYNTQTFNYVDPDSLDFETELWQYTGPYGALGLMFNCAVMPSADPHFRRALTFVTNGETFMRPFATQPRLGVSPFYTDQRDETYISDDVRSAFTDYGWDSAEFDKAHREMELGGFEQNSDGMYLFKEGDREGEPLEWEVWTYTAWDWVVDQGGQWLDDMEEFGINLEFRQDDALWMRARSTDFIMDTSYHGGGSPVNVMATNLGDDAISGIGNPQTPDTLDAPPVGETWEDYDGELETYETRAMTDQMSITTDEGRLQQLIDELSWVHNQVVPSFATVVQADEQLLNNEVYDYLSQEENPEKWMRHPYARMYYNGAVEYVPEDER